MITDKSWWLELCQGMGFGCTKYGNVLRINDSKDARMHLYWGDGTMVEMSTREYAEKFATGRVVSEAINERL